MCNRIVSEVSKRLKEHFLGPFWGPLKRGHFTPFRWGLKKGLKVEVFDGLRICSDADVMVLVDTE